MDVQCLIQLSLLLLSLCCIDLSHTLPIQTGESNEIALEIRVLENPKLFGGDIVGYVRKNSHLRNALPNDIQLWPNGVIPFVLDVSLEKQRELVYKAMNNYYENTCVKFIPRTTEYDYVNITKSSGCFSNVGRIGGMQVLSLGEGCHFVGTAVHELGHAVGFFHEHQRSDRDYFIDVKSENIKEDAFDQFDKMSPEDNRILVPYDYNSVMHYGPTAFSRNGALITMSPKKAGASLLEVYNKYGLSQADIYSVKKLYNCV